MTRSLARLLAWSAAVALAVLVPAAAGASTTASATAPPALSPDQRVYDLTGSSLDEQGTARVQAAVDRVVATGADPVVVVRALDATPEETLDQVEQLQVAWAEATGAPMATTVAVLVNRNPDDDTDARAGIFVGTTYDDGNVPRGEQEDIVADELIPPLRDGDVASSLVAGLDRLAASIRDGPPRSAFEDVAETAIGWVVAGVVALAAGLALVLRRLSDLEPRILEVTPPATTDRPGDLPPALAAALVHGRARASAVTATLLDLARRGALVLLPEDDGEGWASTPSIAVRLWSDGPVASPIERVLWDRLADRAEDGRVDGGELGRLVRSPGPVVDAVTEQLDERGWRDPTAPDRVRRATLVAVVGGILALVAVVFTAGAGQASGFLGLVAGAALMGYAVHVATATPRLSAAGQHETLRWRAYRDGLREAAEQDPPGLDLAAALPDLVAMEVADRCREHLEEDSSALVDYVAEDQRDAAGVVAAFPWWTAVLHTAAPPSAGGVGVVTGGGVAGGGGAAGST